MIGQRLRRLRLARGLTQRDLAAPRYTHAYVSSIEAGRRRPSREALEHFASKLGVEVEEIATGRPGDLATKLMLRLGEARVALSAGGLDEAAAVFRAVAREARRYRLPTVEARAEEGLGMRLERRGEPEEALHHYQRAEELLRSGPVTAMVDAVAGKARCLHSLGDVRYEIHLLETLLVQIEREGLRDPDALARVHAGLVFAYVEAGLYDKAAESATELDALAPRISDPARVAQMNMTVARLYLVNGDLDAAHRSLQRAEDAYRQLDLKAEIGFAYLARGYVFSREGRLAEAREELERALEIFRETADEKDVVRALNELARVERLGERLDRAQELLEQSITLMGTSDTPILAWAHRELGLVLGERDIWAAEKHLRMAIELYELSEQSVDIAVTYRALGDLASARGDSDASCEAYRTGILALEARL